MASGQVAINISGSGGGGGGSSGGASLDVALAREEALHRFRDINWATYTRCVRGRSSPPQSDRVSRLRTY